MLIGRIGTLNVRRLLAVLHEVERVAGQAIQHLGGGGWGLGANIEIKSSETL